MTLRFGRREDAEAAERALWGQLLARRQAQGYTVERGEIIGKTNGVDRPDAQRTTHWADPGVRDPETGEFLVPDLDVADR